MRLWRTLIATFTTMKHAGHLCSLHSVIMFTYSIHSSTREPTLRMRERTAAKGAGPRGHAELLTVVDQVALNNDRLRK